MGNVLRALLTASVTAALVAAGAPAAHAAPLGFDCRFVMVSHDLLTGNSSENVYTGFAVGYSDVGDNAQIRCYVKVDGSEAASTPTGTGTDFAVTSGQLTFTDLGFIEFCAAPADDPSTHSCRPATRTEIPYADATEIATLVGAAIICPVLALVDGVRVPGIVEVKDGDLYLLTFQVWDCPPFSPPGNGPWSTLLVLT